jgi:hypothetical protein
MLYDAQILVRICLTRVMKMFLAEEATSIADWIGNERELRTKRDTYNCYIQ